MSQAIPGMIKRIRFIFIGLSGSGKTTVGRALSQRLNIDFFDSDILIESEMGMSISGFFESYGEKEFRKIEVDVIKKILSKESFILSLGGGAIENKHTLSKLEEEEVIWLDASNEVLCERIKMSGIRPLLKNDCIANIEVLREKRIESYKKIAKLYINNDLLNVDECVEQILNLYKVIE